MITTFPLETREVRARIVAVMGVTDYTQTVANILVENKNVIVELTRGST